MTHPEQDTVDPRVQMRSILQRIATGPDLSKDISQGEARDATRHILDARVDPVQAALFLIALRMKRETDDENKGVLQALLDTTQGAEAAVDEVVDIADPYDGYNRTLPASPFLPALLAACGVAAVSHGLEYVGPKYGTTHRQVLRAAGLPVDLPVDEATARLSDPEIGWAYVDQAHFAPALRRLVDFRTLLVKRPVLTTVEVLCGPIRGRKKTHLVTGYVHKPYPRIYALLARHAGFDSALLVRGIEGGVIPSLRQTGRFVRYADDGQEQASEFEPTQLGIEQELRAAPIPDDLPGLGEMLDPIAGRPDNTAVATAAAEAGIAALRGEQGIPYDALLYGASAVLWHLGRAESITDAGRTVRQVLDSGAAFERLR